MKRHLIVIGIAVLLICVGLSGCTTKKHISLIYEEMDNCIKITLMKVGENYDEDIGYSNYSFFIYIPDYPSSPQQIIDGNIEFWKKGESIYVGLDDHDDWIFTKINDFNKPINEIEGWIEVSVEGETSITGTFNK